ncbi:hypothetical protein ABT237_04260 [Streptomyces sp. NPDC001581]|uniref:hypothetical protein n=1 Tax=Streptomyces sp. NPDC001581 TaxID=3154386 RepID=UPI003316792C
MLTILCGNAKVRRVRVHDLRHTYAHVMQTTLRAAADRMDDALGIDESGEEEGDAREESPAA